MTELQLRPSFRPLISRAGKPRRSPGKVRLKRLLVGLLVAGAVLVCGAATAQAPAPVWMTRACPAEDSVNCYWDAGARGNGHGQSFFAVRVGREVCVLYTNDRYARRHNHCSPEG